MHVYEKAIESKIGEVYVATCDEEIASEVRKNGGKFIMTDINHTTGTDRVFEASQKLNLKDIDFIMNIQGDEPMINPLDIKNLNKLNKEKNLNISTLAYNIESYDNIYQHFGIYLFKYSALKKFVNLKKSKNEIKERLEQLRAIDNNMKIDVLLANYFSSGIDTKKDLEEYINLLNK